ncbi:MAG: site-specific integrase [Tannerella sp.]|jgi:integrase|nr:site-specific integrase [Tannerella sp.]
MASILTKLDTRRADKKGNYPVKIVIFSNQTNASISLNVSIPEKAWIRNGEERPVKTTYPGAKTINDDIQSLFIEFRHKVNDLELKGKAKKMKAADIKRYILSERAEVADAEILFSDFAADFAEGCKSSGTKRNYLHTIGKMKEYAENVNISFEEINLSFLRQFDDYLSKSGSGVNTRSIHFRNIRAIFNRAIDDEIINQDIYPFRKFKIKSKEKDKVSLNSQKVKMLYEYNFKTKSLSMARDYWILSFLLCGINPIDLYHLKKPGKDSIISFERSKTRHESHHTIRLLLQPEAMEIINKYNDSESEYLLNFESKYVNYEIFRSFLSKKIREIAKITGLTGLTMYWARYSWATIADGLDIPEKTISKALGHVDKSLAGRTYITFDWSKVDKANREVIDHVLK